MAKLKMDNDLFVNDLMSGSGTTKYYDYFVSGIKVRNKSDVYGAIKLKIANIIRKDKIDGKIAKFHYKSLRFENETNKNKK